MISKRIAVVLWSLVGLAVLAILVPTRSATGRTTRMLKATNEDYSAAEIEQQQQQQQRKLQYGLGGYMSASTPMGRDTENGGILMDPNYKVNRDCGPGEVNTVIDLSSLNLRTNFPIQGRQLPDGSAIAVSVYNIGAILGDFGYNANGEFQVTMGQNPNDIVYHGESPFPESYVRVKIEFETPKKGLYTSVGKLTSDASYTKAGRILLFGDDGHGVSSEYYKWYDGAQHSNFKIQSGYGYWDQTHVAENPAAGQTGVSMYASTQHSPDPPAGLHTLVDTKIRMVIIDLGIMSLSPTSPDTDSGGSTPYMSSFLPGFEMAYCAESGPGPASKTKVVRASVPIVKNEEETLFNAIAELVGNMANLLE